MEKSKTCKTCRFKSRGELDGLCINLKNYAMNVGSPIAIVDSFGCNRWEPLSKHKQENQ